MQKFLQNISDRNKQYIERGTPLVVQRLWLQTPNSEGPGSIPGQGTRSHMLQLKIPCATTKTWYSQINKYLKQTNNIQKELYTMTKRGSLEGCKAVLMFKKQST